MYPPLTYDKYYCGGFVFLLKMSAVLKTLSSVLPKLFPICPHAQGTCPVPSFLTSLNLSFRWLPSVLTSCFIASSQILLPCTPEVPMTSHFHVCCPIITGSALLHFSLSWQVRVYSTLSSVKSPSHPLNDLSHNFMCVSVVFMPFACSCVPFFLDENVSLSNNPPLMFHAFSFACDH